MRIKGGAASDEFGGVCVGIAIMITGKVRFTRPD
jgi:hypothetical protein